MGKAINSLKLKKERMDITAYKNSDLELRMSASFADASRKVLLSEKTFSKSHSGVVVGLEVEYGLVDQNYRAVTEEQRNRIIHGLEFAEVELGASQIELRTDKRLLTTMKGLYDDLTDREEQIAKKTRAAGLKIVRYGTNPFIQIDEIKRTMTDKYQKVPDFHDTYKNPFTPTKFGLFEQVDPRPAQIISLFNSMQCNIEAKDFADAIDKANRSYMISPYLISISGNSRFLEVKDLGFSDTRMDVWEISHDVRTNEQLLSGNVTRVGKYDSYLQSMGDYFERVGSYPFILDNESNAIRIGIGLFWRDVRIKLMGNSCVVELRPISTQPTPAEDIAINAFYIGRLTYSQHVQDPLLDIIAVNNNRQSAMKDGLRSQLVYLDEHNVARIGNSVEVLQLELSRAEIGLEFAGIESAGYLDILREKLKIRAEPSALLKTALDTTSTGTDVTKERLANAFRLLRDSYGTHNGNEDPYA